MRPEVRDWLMALSAEERHRVINAYDPARHWNLNTYLDDEYLMRAGQIPAAPIRGYANFAVNWGELQRNVAPGGMIPLNENQMNWVYQNAEAQQQAPLFYPQYANALGALEYPREPEVEEVPQEADQMPAHWKALNPFRVGCDPEFVAIQKDGQLYPANAALPGNGPVGWDHNGRIAEFRPRASRSIKTLIQHLYALIHDEVRLGSIRNYRWKSGGLYQYPNLRNFEALGGHVHLDVPYQAPETATKDYTERLSALDRLTLHFEELDILPRGESRRRRTESHYGQFGDTRPAGPRLQPRLEYRSPASWLFSPRTAFAVLTGYKLAAQEPAATLALLGKTPSSKELKRFFAEFAGADDDTRLLCEKFVSDGGLMAVRGDVDADFRETWSKLPAALAA